ncbi:MAG: Rieske 2Fe-2S domain-containing protein [Sphingomonadaceae bacterium]|nr:Rieske 2Fe-2S domain-containing protein [Sphingomonadaceae bacterium]
MTDEVMQTRIFVGDLQPGQAIKLRHQFPEEPRPQHIFLIKTSSGSICAYRNICPHMRAMLDAGKGDFFDETGLNLRCKVHGALFDPESGICIEGPCQDAALTAVSLGIEGDEAVIE